MAPVAPWQVSHMSFGVSRTMGTWSTRAETSPATTGSGGEFVDPDAGTPRLSGHHPVTTLQRGRPGARLQIFRHWMVVLPLFPWGEMPLHQIVASHAREPPLMSSYVSGFQKDAKTRESEGLAFEFNLCEALPSREQDEEAECITKHGLEISDGQCLGGICSYELMSKYNTIHAKVSSGNDHSKWLQLQ